MLSGDVNVTSTGLRYDLGLGWGDIRHFWPRTANMRTGYIFTVRTSLII